MNGETIISVYIPESNLNYHMGKKSLQSQIYDQHTLHVQP